MQEVIIRTNYGKNIGLGHLFRVLKLANELKKYYHVVFAVDQKSDIIKKVLTFEVIELYKNSIFKNQIDDANLLKKRTKNKNIKFIIVDDYRLDFNWEKKFFRNFKVIAFDDSNTRKHQCHYIIDGKWNGEVTNNRYKNLVPKNCIKLLGPKYAIINSELNKNKIKKNILVYFGGAGDLSKYHDLILQFCEANKVLKTKTTLDLIIGPLAYNYQKVIDLTNKFNFINIVKNKFNLSIYLNRCKFAFSSSSSIIYELNYLNIPTCLFSTSENQKNEISDLEDLGFFLNINLKNLKKSNKSQLLFASFLKNLNRIKKLQNQKKITIDKKAVKRIVISLNKKNNKKIKGNVFKNHSNFKKGFFKISDNFINRYLKFRNLDVNRKNSLNQSRIEKHDHYIWWLNNYKLIDKYYYYNKKILSIFYHQKIKINELTYWYGGWMVGETKPKLFDIIHFLNFQIRITIKKENLKWIAIIKKKNKFVYLINKKLKFNNIKDQYLISGIRKRFNISNKDKYYFLIK